MSRYARLVRASAWYDLLVTAPFATPWTYGLAHRALSGASSALGLGELPPQEPMLVLFANLMGSVVVVWSLLRLLRPLPVHGLFDGAARALFACWQGYALAHGATGLLWGFLAVEVAFGAAQLWPWRSADRRARWAVRRPAVVGGGVQSGCHTARTGVRRPRSGSGCVFLRAVAAQCSDEP